MHTCTPMARFRLRETLLDWFGRVAAATAIFRSPGCEKSISKPGLVERGHRFFGALPRDVRTLNLLPTDGFFIKPLKVKLLAGEQKATEV